MASKREGWLREKDAIPVDEKINNHSESNNSTPPTTPPLHPSFSVRHLQTHKHVHPFFFSFTCLWDFILSTREKKNAAMLKTTPPPPPPRPSNPHPQSSQTLLSVSTDSWLVDLKNKKEKKRLLVFYRWPFWFVVFHPHPTPPPEAIRPSRYLTLQQDHVATVYKLPWGLPLPNWHCNVFSSVC